MLKVGLVCAHNPFDRNNFSGTAYYIHQALMRAPDVQVEVIGERFHQARSLSSRAYKSLNNGRFASFTWIRDRLFRQFVAIIERDLARLGPDLDLLVAPVASEIIASLRPGSLPPILFITDATPQYIRETYPQPVEDIAFEQERAALSRCSKVIYSSHFMAERAKREFSDILGTYQDKVKVIPFGLNMAKVPQQGAPKEPVAPIELLFVGKDWHRKGGSLAIEMLSTLRERGVETRLTVVGCQPDPSKLPRSVEVIPYLNKNVPDQQNQYIEILKRTHFLVLPTRADCTPMVIAEANAFGIPAIVSDVGGIPTLVENGVNGFLIPVTAPGCAYADCVSNLLKDSDGYIALARSSRRIYEERLNWDAWTQQILRLATSPSGVTRSSGIEPGSNYTISQVNHGGERSDEYFKSTCP